MIDLLQAVRDQDWDRPVARATQMLSIAIELRLIMRGLDGLGAWVLTPIGVDVLRGASGETVH